MDRWEYKMSAEMTRREFMKRLNEYGEKKFKRPPKLG
jgi:hypothetical protein